MEDFGSKSILDKHMNKYDVYDNILEYFVDIPFKLSDRIGQNCKDLKGEEDSEHEYDPKKILTPWKKSTNYAIIKKQKNF